MKKLILLVCSILILVSVNGKAQTVKNAETGNDKNRDSVKSVSAKPAAAKPDMAENSEHSTKTYEKDQILTLVRVGKVDKKTAEDAKAWIEKSIYPPISVNIKKVKYSKKFADKSVLFGELKKINRDNLAIVALVEETPAGISISNSVNVADSTGIVYLKPYMTEYAKENPKLELYKWRVNKQVLKAAALALGLKKCPFPRCCLSPDYDDARIDEKGRNLCPPCWNKMYDLMKSKGIKEPIPSFLKNK
jgi:predicted Zn-dependent protease